MTTTSEPGSVDQPKNDEGASSTPDIAKLQEQLNSVVQERDNWKLKHRELEQTAKDAKTIKKQLDDLMVSNSALSEEFKTYKDSIKQEKLNTTLSTALETAGAHKVSTALKLLDLSKLEFGEDGSVKQESITAVIEAAKAEDPHLYKEVTDPSKKTTVAALPAAKRAADVVTEDAFTTELKLAQKEKNPQKAIEALLRKYGKI